MRCNRVNLPRQLVLGTAMQSLKNTHSGGGSTELTPKQLRQLAKQERRRKYADLAIQGTNNSSIASKRSVERLYLSKMGVNESVDEPGLSREYFKFFVPKPLRRSPCINRGYWLRIYAVKSKIDAIAAATMDQRIVVINLGCGFDPLPFQLLDPLNKQNKQYQNRLSFVDLDYPDLLQNKKKIIESSPELTAIVGDWKKSNRGNGIYEAEKYILAACDLNLASGFQALMSSLELEDPSVIKIFVAEVSLAYMKTSKANEIITACGQLDNSHFIILEQLLPVGPSEPFSKQMLKHFRKNDSPLQSVENIPTKIAQQARFQECGFPYTNIGNMYQLWETIADNVKDQIESIEAFDELEEFFLFCHHYVIGHSTNVSDFLFQPKFLLNGQDDKQDFSTRTMSVLPNSLADGVLERKFGASAMLPSGEIIYAQGCFNSRLDDVLIINPVLHTVKNLDINASAGGPQGRMCHTLTHIDGDLCLMAGGRGGPNQAFSDTWLLKRAGKGDGESDWHFQKGLSLPEPRYRHAACALNASEVLIFGGRTDGGKFLIYDSLNNTILSPAVQGNVPLLKSAALAFNKDDQVGVIVGGSTQNDEVQDKMITFKYDGRTRTIIIENVHFHPLFKRYGSKCIFTCKGRVLIIGGSGPEVLLGQKTSIIEVCLDSGQITLIEVPKSVWDTGLPMLVGFEVQRTSQDKYYILGGGAVCYGFGSVWNSGLHFQIASH
ncbi:LADA_0D00496g1_1 [Lachancea dasiensis]|uniref:tRNA wybutosine-synthesizing protein 4 n=1 Tax=Lachancea dasiensis TaxID=1072105 RepID=A0A1G4J3A4_9SACH|nr:LADA_0D00496g1_1 [Lachancea dasiensis]